MTANDESPAIDDGARPHPDQPGENLDASKLPDEIPDRPLSSFEHGTTEREQREGEPLDAKLARERSDDRGVATPLGTQSTTVMDDADPDGLDTEKDLVADRPVRQDVDDSGRPGVPTSAEESAVRIESTDDVGGATDRRGR